MRTSLIGVGSLALLGAVVFAQQQQEPQRGGDQGQQRAGAQTAQLNLFDLKGQVFVLEFINPTHDKWLDLHKGGGLLGKGGELEETHEQYKEKGVVWLAVCPYVDPTEQAQGTPGIARMYPQQLQELIEQLDLHMPIFFDENGKVMKSLQVTEVPSIVIVDKHGRISYSAALRGETGEMLGVANFDRALEQAVNAPFTPGASLPAGAPRDQPKTDRQPGGQGDDAKRRR